ARTSRYPICFNPPMSDLRVQDWARLIPAVILILTALLAVFRAPTHFLWMLAVVVTEWGHLFAILCFGLALLLWSRSRGGRIAASLCLIAAALMLTPVLRAEWMTQDLSHRLIQSFGQPKDASRPPLQLSRLFLPFSSPAPEPKTITYRKIDGMDLSLD